MGAWDLDRRDRLLSSGGAAFLDGLRAIIRENRIVDERAS